MKVISLLYHDVLEGNDLDSSGLPGPVAGRYKLDLREFRLHLDAIGQAAAAPPTLVHRLDSSQATPVLLTFDDGGRTAYAPIADLLEERGWRGHFFVTSDFIATPPFLTPAQMRDLAARGHVIGSHSASHPTRMAHLSVPDLMNEWQRSSATIGDILGEAVTTASVPGGYYAPEVARAAAQAGIRTLFNSEPVTGTVDVEGCRVYGRYTLWRGMSPQTAAAFAAGRPGVRARQWVFWNTKKLAKASFGSLYLRLQTVLLDRAHSADLPR